MSSSPPPVSFRRSRCLPATSASAVHGWCLSRSAQLRRRRSSANNTARIQESDPLPEGVPGGTLQAPLPLTSFAAGAPAAPVDDPLVAPAVPVEVAPPPPVEPGAPAAPIVVVPATPVPPTDPPGPAVMPAAPVFTDAPAAPVPPTAPAVPVPFMPAA